MEASRQTPVATESQLERDESLGKYAIDTSIHQDPARLATVAESPIFMADIEYDPARDYTSLNEQILPALYTDAANESRETLAEDWEEGIITKENIELVHAVLPIIKENMYSADQERHPTNPHLQRNDDNEVVAIPGSRQASYLFDKPSFLEGHLVLEAILAKAIKTDEGMKAAFEDLRVRGHGFLNVEILLGDSESMSMPLPWLGPYLYLLRYGLGLDYAGYSEEAGKRGTEHLLAVLAAKRPSFATKRQGVNKYIRTLNQAGCTPEFVPFHQYEKGTPLFEMIGLETITISSIGSAVDRPRGGKVTRMQDKLFDSPNWFGTTGVISSPAFVRAFLLRYRVTAYRAIKEQSENLPPLQFKAGGRFSDRYERQWIQNSGPLYQYIQRVGLTIQEYLVKLRDSGSALKTLQRLLDEQYGVLDTSDVTFITRTFRIGKNASRNKEVSEANKCFKEIKEDLIIMQPRHWKRDSYANSPDPRPREEIDELVILYGGVLDGMVNPEYFQSPEWKEDLQKQLEGLRPAESESLETGQASTNTAHPTVRLDEETRSMMLAHRGLNDRYLQQAAKHHLVTVDRPSSLKDGSGNAKKRNKLVARVHKQLKGASLLCEINDDSSPKITEARVARALALPENKAVSMVNNNIIPHDELTSEEMRTRREACRMFAKELGIDGNELVTIHLATRPGQKFPLFAYQTKKQDFAQVPNLFYVYDKARQVPANTKPSVERAEDAFIAFFVGRFKRDPVEVRAFVLYEDPQYWDLVLYTSLGHAFPDVQFLKPLLDRVRKHSTRFRPFKDGQDNEYVKRLLDLQKVKQEAQNARKAEVQAEAAARREPMNVISLSVQVRKEIFGVAQSAWELSTQGIVNWFNHVADDNLKDPNRTLVSTLLRLDLGDISHLELVSQQGKRNDVRLSLYGVFSSYPSLVLEEDLSFQDRPASKKNLEKAFNRVSANHGNAFPSLDECPSHEERLDRRDYIYSRLPELIDEIYVAYCAIIKKHANSGLEKTSFRERLNDYLWYMPFISHGNDEVYWQPEELTFIEMFWENEGDTREALEVVSRVLGRSPGAVEGLVKYRPDLLSGRTRGVAPPPKEWTALGQ